MKFTKKLKLTVFATVVMSTVYIAKAQTPRYDFVIKKVTLFDGSGKDSVICDVAIYGDKIAFVGQLKGKYTATMEIEGKGLYLSPGFIDPHTHYYSNLKHTDSSQRILPRAIRQGVTTVFEGNDGSGPLPLKKTQSTLEKLGIGPNVAFYVGHNTVRASVLGQKDVQPTPAQLAEMEKIVETAMKDGAFGLSTGLFYTPGNYAKTAEVVALSKVAKKYGGVYDTHQRDEGSQNIGVLNSTKEVLNIGYQTGIPVHFSHIKVAGPGAWLTRDSVIYLIEKAQKDGLKVTANQYPYTASKTGLSSALVPAWARNGGISAMRERFKQPELRDSIAKGINQSINARTADASKLIISSRDDEEIHSLSIQAIADKWKMSPAEAVIKMCTSASPSIISFMMQEEDIETFMKKPWVMTGSDGGSGHPRGFGSFVRVIEEYSQNRKLVSMSQAIYKSSYLTAKTLNVANRGLVKTGYFADLFLFDPQHYENNNSYENPEVVASGVKYLWVNGKLAIENENLIYNLSGQALRLNRP